TCQWAIFLRNHDELTLEMVTDEERDYMYKTYAKDPKARINLGIRHRLSPLVGNNRPKIELLNCLLFSLPGTPVIYYGDEIGMGDNVYLGDRNGVRTPMQWSPDRNAGFSEANPQKLYLPLILDPEYQYEYVNVEMQRSNTSSLFWFMKRIIAMRKRSKVFGRGNMCFLKIDNPKVLGFTRSYQSETLLVIINLSKFSQPAEVDLSSYRGYRLMELMSRNQFPQVREDGNYFFTLAPYAYHWFLMTKAGDVLPDTSSLPILEMKSFQELDSAKMIALFETALLPEYLPKMSWFNGLNKTLYSVNISHHTIISIGETKVWWLLIDVTYQSGLPEIYQFVVDIIGDAEGEKLNLTSPMAVIARAKINGEHFYICDGFYTAILQNELIHKMAGQFSIPTNEGRIDFYGNSELAKHWLSTEEIRPKLSAYGHDNTSITYDNRFFLKMYRKVDVAINPDLEITRFLTNEAKFKYMPAFIGAIEWKTDQDAIVLGILQEMIENHGDGYSYVLERMNNYIERLLANTKGELSAFGYKGTLLRPVPYDELDEDLQLLLGAPAAEQASLLGKRAGEMHLALASGLSPDFVPENFSIHYQRSLFSNMQSLVRETFQRLAGYSNTGNPLRIDFLLKYKNTVLARLKQIYEKKFEMKKIRIHGNFRLGQVLLTGRDLAIQDYGGDPAHSYSERRLKRSPLFDIATMVSSLYHVSFEAFEKSPHIPPAGKEKWMPFYALWAHYMSGFFVNAWIQTVQGTSLIPSNEKDLHIILEVYLLQQALFDLNEQLLGDSRQVKVPLDMLAEVMNNMEPGVPV
ncbi:MAG TPA: alpha-glucosidase C-terminal domain-containing protein, partial [Puia sp.]